MADLTFDDFSGGIGQAFGLRADGGKVDLVLDKAEPLSRSVREAGAFRLEFLGPVDPFLPQAIYPITVGGNERDIFIVPIARDRAGTRYEAIFY